jgi:putative oxidoreductase
MGQMDRAEGGPMNRSLPSIRLLGIGLRWAFGLLFIWAAVGKIVDPVGFAQQVVRYQIVGPQASAIVGIALPWMEFVVGACLCFDIGAAGAWLGTALLLACFVIARVLVISRGLSIDCGCGFMDGTITPRSTAIPAGLLLLSIVAYLDVIRMSACARRPRSAIANHSSAEVIPCA